MTYANAKISLFTSLIETNDAFALLKKWPASDAAVNSTGPRGIRSMLAIKSSY